MIFIIIYIVSVIISYYTSRYLLKKSTNSWNYDDVFAIIFFSLLIPIIIIILAFIFNCPINNNRKPPKWL